MSSDTNPIFPTEGELIIAERFVAIDRHQVEVMKQLRKQQKQLDAISVSVGVLIELVHKLTGNGHP